MGTLSDGHGPLLVHSSKLLPLIVALEILYTWDGDYALVRPGVLHRVVPVTLVRPGLHFYFCFFNFNYALVWPRYYTGMVPEALAHCNWCGLGFIPVWSQKLLQLQLHLPGVTLGDLANGGLALVWPCVLHSMVPVALEDPDLETWYWRGPYMTQRGPSDSEDLGD